MNATNRNKILQGRYARCLETLESRGQGHVLRWWKNLTPNEQEHLLLEVEAIEWGIVDSLVESHVRRRPDKSVSTDIEPAPVHRATPAHGQESRYQEASRSGLELIKSGKVAAFTVAGGQGTRLGFDGPKGAVAVSPIRNKTLFQLFAEAILAVRTRYDVAVPWYIMTSPDNHEQTVAYLRDHDYFGLPSGDVVLFAQGMLPVFDFSGQMLLEDKHRLCLAPDGHGGSLKALVASDALTDMSARGVEIVSYFQVDNPLVKPFDPLFIGLHAETGSEMSTKVTPKADDLERVGNLCLCDGRVTVIEYSDFPENLATARGADGSRRFDLGNLAIHLLNVDFVDRIVGKRFELPFRRAEKAVAWLDEHGVKHTPSEPNAVKLETFVFDALPLAGNPLLFEIDRADEFSPVKNPDGVDSIESAVRDQIRRGVRWLEAAGVNIPRAANGDPQVTVEIAPSYALDAADVARRSTEARQPKRGETIYLA